MSLVPGMFRVLVVLFFRVFINICLELSRSANLFLATQTADIPAEHSPSGDLAGYIVTGIKIVHPDKFIFHVEQTLLINSISRSFSLKLKNNKPLIVASSENV